MLSVLFSFVGKGHFLYVAGVSRSWKWHYTLKAASEGGELLTTWKDAIVTVTTLEHAFANGLEFTPESHPERDAFGLGVYEWAREHGFPFFVWVAIKKSEQEFNRVVGVVLGVFSSVNKAKHRALSGFSTRSTVTKWVSIGSGEFKCLWRDDKSYMKEANCLYIKPFAVTGLGHANETEPLPLYMSLPSKILLSNSMLKACSQQRSWRMSQSKNSKWQIEVKVKFS